MNIIPLKEITPDEPKTMTLDLLKNMDPNDVQNEKSRGQLVVEVMYKPFKEEEVPDDIEDPNEVQKAPDGTPAGGGLLVIIIHEAVDVEGKHHTNPYARLLFRGEERKTKVYFSFMCSDCCFWLLDVMHRLHLIVLYNGVLHLVKKKLLLRANLFKAAKVSLLRYGILFICYGVSPTNLCF